MTELWLEFHSMRCYSTIFQSQFFETAQITDRLEQSKAHQWENQIELTWMSCRINNRSQSLTTANIKISYKNSST